MTLFQAHTKAVLYYLRERQGLMTYNWPEIAEIRYKIGCTKRQLEKIIEKMEEAGEVLLGMRGGNVVLELVNTKGKALAEGNPQALLEKEVNQNV